MTKPKNHPLHDLAMDIRYDLTAAQSKLTELIRQIAEIAPPARDPERASFLNGPVTADHCPACGVGADNHTHDCPTLTQPNDTVTHQEAA
jgi:hypothetical protein